MDEKDSKIEEVASNKEVKSKKGKKTVLTVSIIAIVVAALCVGGFFAYRLLMKKDPVKVTSKAIRGLKDNIADVKDNNSEITKLLESKDAFEIKSNIKLDLPKELGNDYLVKFLAQADPEGQDVKFDLSAKEGSETILDLSTLVDQTKVYFKFNDTMDNYYYTKLEETVSSINLEELPVLPDYDYENIIDYLADAIDGALSTKDFEKEKDELTIGTKDIKVTKYTTTIDEVKLKAIADKFLDKVSSDKKLVSVIAEISGESESDIKDAIKEFKNTKASELGDIEFDYSVYVTSSGEAIAYGFGYEGAEFIIGDYKDTLSLQVLAQGMRLALEVEKKSDDHYVVTLDYMGVITGTLDIKKEFKTIEKNEEYKYTLEANLNLNVMGQDSIKGSLVADTTFKKIDKVDTSAKIGAKDIENLTSSEEYQFENEVMKSKNYDAIVFLTNMFGSLEE